MFSIKYIVLLLVKYVALNNQLQINFTLLPLLTSVLLVYFCAWLANFSFHRKNYFRKTIKPKIKNSNETKIKSIQYTQYHAPSKFHDGSIVQFIR